MLGANVLYFLSAPMMRLRLPFEPLDPHGCDPGPAQGRGAVSRQRICSSTARHGAKLAKRVMADIPDAEVEEMFKFGESYS